jgi:hypothetical protein
MECGKPWGVVLERGSIATDDVIAQCRAEMQQDLRDYWGIEDDEPFDASHVNVYTCTVVFIRESTNRFVDENNICEATAEDESWNELSWVDYPAWILNGCKHRTAVRWDCCNITETDCKPKVEALTACLKDL